MIAVLTFLIIMIVSVLVTKIATVALSHTGLSRESARFQARSAFTGVGFTTAEAEKVVGHPVRRRILMILMLLGNAGIVTAISSLILSFVRVEKAAFSPVERLGVILGGLAVLWFLAASPLVDRWLARVVGWALLHWTRIDVRDYASLLHLSGDYRVQELRVEKDDWLAGKSLEELRLTDEGVLVLGIQRPGGVYLGAPTKEAEIRAGDQLILYGRDATLIELDQRRAGWTGDVEHREAVEEQREVVEKQKEEDEKAKDDFREE